eukprot:SAG31_NODE_45765_length_257_cov_0.974684_1_plen_43_part_01
MRRPGVALAIALAAFPRAVRCLGLSNSGRLAHLLEDFIWNSSA